ncbi:hypothetical protein CBR_g54342 [Chara braunii]|uniref:Sulfotransferase n=1 Tax=Chara braunii TaxID=69332 RepID=A0A388MBZ5_CHABU|nr:hypothetical protein CBR_g54342 [Chara braunii]|eukprot:GBG92087.1 hypothetical protein CBR_g54342 [Chara braunii]
MGKPAWLWRTTSSRRRLVVCFVIACMALLCSLLSKYPPPPLGVLFPSASTSISIPISTSTSTSTSTSLIENFARLNSSHHDNWYPDDGGVRGDGGDELRQQTFVDDEATGDRDRDTPPRGDLPPLQGFLGFSSSPSACDEDDSSFAIDGRCRRLAAGAGHPPSPTRTTSLPHASATEERGSGGQRGGEDGEGGAHETLPLEPPDWRQAARRFPSSAANCAAGILDRPPPQLLIIGSQKAGTTSLYRYLCDHYPDVACIARNKEPGTLAWRACLQRRHNGCLIPEQPIDDADDQIDQIDQIDAIQDPMDQIEDAEDRTSKGKERRYKTYLSTAFRMEQAPQRKFVTIDATTWYYMEPSALKLVEELLPCSLLILCVREPLSKAISWYRHLTQRPEKWPFLLQAGEEENGVSTSGSLGASEAGELEWERSGGGRDLLQESNKTEFISLEAALAAELALMRMCRNLAGLPRVQSDTGFLIDDDEDAEGEAEEKEELSSSPPPPSPLAPAAAADVTHVDRHPITSPDAQPSSGRRSRWSVHTQTRGRPEPKDQTSQVDGDWLERGTQAGFDGPQSELDDGSESSDGPGYDDSRAVDGPGSDTGHPDGPGGGSFGASGPEGDGSTDGQPRPSRLSRDTDARRRKLLQVHLKQEKEEEIAELGEDGEEKEEGDAEYNDPRFSKFLRCMHRRYPLKQGFVDGHINQRSAMGEPLPMPDSEGKVSRPSRELTALDGMKRIGPTRSVERSLQGREGGHRKPVGGLVGRDGLLLPGLYAHFLDLWIRTIGWERVMVVNLDAWKDHAKPMLDKVTDFLGLSRFNRTAIEMIEKEGAFKVGQGPVPELSERMQREICKELELHNRLFFKMVGKDLGWRCSPHQTLGN